MPNMPHFKQWSASDTCETVDAETVYRPVVNTVSLYPNPASYRLTITSSLASSQPRHLRIFDTQGRLGLEFEHPDYTRTWDFDISALPPGYYLVEVECSDGRRYVEKIAVMK